MVFVVLSWYSLVIDPVVAILLDTPSCYDRLTTHPLIIHPLITHHLTTHPLVSTGSPSECFMIRNMFDPAEENEENWDQEIREDVMEECGKYGTVVHCHVEKVRPGDTPVPTGVFYINPHI